MQKKLAFLLNVALLGGLTNSLQASDELETVLKIGALGALGTGGYYLHQMNNEYSKKNKKPDNKMRLAKAGTAICSIIALDIIADGKSTTKQHVAKIVAATVAMVATTQPVADALQYCPPLAGLLTDPIDEDGDERKDMGAIARFALAYIPLRKLAMEITGEPRK